MRPHAHWEVIHDSSDSDEDAPPSPHLKQLMDYVIDLYFGSVLKANHLCIIMYHLREMGYKDAAPYAVKPDKAHSGKYQEKLTKAFNFKEQEIDLYPLDVPLRDPHTAEREVQKILVQAPHEALHREFLENPEMIQTWQDKVEEHENWVPIYENHPAIRGRSKEEKKHRIGLCLYMDGAEYTNKDGLILFTIRFCCSSKRHLVWAVRKNQMCDCSCGGWCSLSTLFQYIAWSLEALQEGLFPAKSWNGSSLDSRRQKMAGSRLGFIGVVVDILGDWKEFAHSWGFPNWGSHFPCFLCKIPLSLQLNPHIEVDRRANEDYDRHCTACEVFITVTSAAVQSEIRFKLQDDSTHKGLCLTSDVNSVTPKLKKNDRLEPTKDFPDVYAIDDVQVPFQALTLKFWRSKIPKETIVHHRNPILSLALGISYDCFAVDVLHCKHLGVYLAWITRCLHLLFGLDAFATRSSRGPDHMKGNALALKTKAHAWYPEYERTLKKTARRSVTRVNHITDKMLGNEHGTKLVKLKAAESRHFMPFVLALIREYADLLRGRCDYDNLDQAGVCLQQWMLIVQREPRQMSRDAVRQLVSLQRKHNIAAEAAGVHMRPKHHQATLLFCLGIHKQTSETKHTGFK